MFPGSRKFSKTTPSPLPLTSRSTLETTMTLSEIVTPTTETTTQWFSLPYWRKRNVSQPILPRHRSSEKSPARLETRLPSLDKSLPPTPSDDDQHSSNFGPSEVLQHQSSPFSASQQDLKTSQVQSALRSAPVPTSRGLCISLASTSARVEANISTPPVIPNPFLYPGPSPVVSKPFPQMRRAKSAHRLRTPSDTVTSGQLVQRRRRGLSFGATGDTTSKGKGKELEPSPHLSKPLPQPLSRRPSFWSKKKSPTRAAETPQNGSITVLPLPLVDVSPFAPEFTIEPFQLSNPNTKPTVALPFQRPQSDATRRATPGSTTTSSTTSFEVVDVPLPNQRSVSSRPPRGHATPPLLHRLSFGIFSSPEPSPIVRPKLPNQSYSQSATVLPFQKSNIQIPRPSIDGESPEGYVLRLRTHVSKAEVASVLASSSDIFYTRALRAYLNQFEFSGIPLDVALRKFLMEVGLPRETQQIDRVMEAFAFRYRQCNPNIFTSDDHPYILAFSLIMLHTDAFNPSNKRKMTKADYIKNTKLPGIPTEVLDCFFDNIVFAPFIFIEDPEDIDSSSGLITDLAGSVSTSTSLPSAGLNTSFRSTHKVDPYYLIMNDLLDPLRVDVNSYTPLENPFTYEGSNGPWDEEQLYNTFLKAHLIDMEFPLSVRSSTTFSLYPSMSSVSPDACQLYPETCRLKVIKAGVLNKKDDLVEGGKKALSRKWKTWGVILCGSHLLFFRDAIWGSVSRSSSDPSQQQHGAVNTKLRPDDIYSLKDGIAVYDHSYKKYNHTFRFVLPDGRHLLLQAANDEDLQHWISCINYASTFRSAGVRMSPSDVSGPTGAAASTPHLHDMQQVNGQRPRSDMLAGPRNKPESSVVDDLHITPSSESDNASQFKALFKANLAISTSPVDENSLTVQDGDCISESPLICTNNNLRSPPRSQLLQKKIRELDTKITALQFHLESDERHARNIAILTPFRKTTRSKLLTVIQNLAKPLMRMRLEMEKLKCYRTVLLSDLVSGLRMQTKRIALRTATDSLRLRRPKTAPTLMSQTYDDFGKQSSTPTSLSTSTSGSFHSARESVFDPRSEIACDSPLDFYKPEVSIPPWEGEHGDILLGTPSSSPEDLKDRSIHPRRDSSSENVSQGDDDDQAEDWNKTRVAQRVSLIQFPSDFALATRLKAVFDGYNDQG